MSLVVVSLGNWHRSRVICRLKPVMLVGYGFCVKGIFLGSLRSSTFEPSILKAFYWWNRVMARCCGFGGQRAWDFISKELKEPRFRSYTVRFSKVCYYSSLILLWQALWLFFVPTSTVRFLSLTERRDRCVWYPLMISVRGVADWMYELNRNRYIPEFEIVE